MCVFKWTGYVASIDGMVCLGPWDRFLVCSGVRFQVDRLCSFAWRDDLLGSLGSILGVFGCAFSSGQVM
jgi:hypothetical protein